MYAIRQHEFGGPETLIYEQVEDAIPSEGEVRIVVAATGVHLLDTTIRTGVDGGPFPVPDLPMTPGREVAGTVDSVGVAADGSWVGRRVVAHLGIASGGYAEMAVTGAEGLFALPDDVGFTDAVAMVGTGRTAMAILDVAAVTADDVVLVTAAAGGIGALLVQAAKATGATVIGLAGGPAKIGVVEGLGADAGFDYGAPDWPVNVKAGLGERRVTLGLDGVGGAIGRNTFELVAPGGRLVMSGYSSGEVMPLSAGDLYASGVTVTAAIGARMMSRPEGIRAYARDALDALAAGRLRPLVHPPFPLAKASEAHRALESRATTGKVVLVP
jgi:NADPH2:quinone reductase